jgi:tellurite resistance protein
MNNHNHRHDQRKDMHEINCALEYDRVRQLNAARVAVRLYAGVAADGRYGAHERAQRYGRLFAYCVEVAEAHCE